MAVPPQRLRPGTQPEHEDPVSHADLGPSSCAFHHSASSCLRASLSFGLTFTSHTGWGAEGSTEDASGQLPHCIFIRTPRWVCPVPSSHGVGSTKRVRSLDRPTDLSRREPNTFLIPFSLSSPSETPIMHSLVRFTLSHKSHMLLSFFLSFCLLF